MQLSIQNEFNSKWDVRELAIKKGKKIEGGRLKCHARSTQPDTLQQRRNVIRKDSVLQSWENSRFH